MRAFYSDQFVLPLPAGHRFPIAKYRMLRDRLAQELPTLRLTCAPSASDTELALAHTSAYVEAVATGTLSLSALREIGLPWSPQMVERSRRSVGATVAAVGSALQEGVAVSLAGGTHHAFSDHGSGFCVFNDVAVAIKLAQSGGTRSSQTSLSVAVVDLDVHQGNGTAAIFHGDDSVFTLSLHGARNFPFLKQPSDLDVGLPDGCGDAAYLWALEGALRQLDARHRCPDLVVYLAGADPHDGDRLGRLKISFAGLQARDEQVMQWCWQRGIPLAMVMAGGYGVDIGDTVQVHVNSCHLAWRYWSLWQARQVEPMGAGKITHHESIDS